jgi:hypothetical protein
LGEAGRSVAANNFVPTNARLANTNTGHVSGRLAGVQSSLAAFAQKDEPLQPVFWTERVDRS